jgi:hypothetical protein
LTPNPYHAPLQHAVFGFGLNAQSAWCLNGKWRQNKHGSGYLPFCTFKFGRRVDWASNGKLQLGYHDIGTQDSHS